MTAESPLFYIKIQLIFRIFNIKLTAFCCQP